MRPATYSSRELARVFHERKVLTKKQILEIVGCSTMTAWRLLKELGYITSYNFNARHYTLVAIPQFDDHGLWSYRKVRFSKYGSLSLTVINLVRSSISGLSMDELRTLLQVNATPTLIRLHHRGEISREKVGPVYFYLSNDASVRQGQLACHEAEQKKTRELQSLPEPERIIAVLVELVKAVGLEPDQVYRRLRHKGISITRDEIRRIWFHYGLAKKKRF